MSVTVFLATTVFLRRQHLDGCILPRCAGAATSVPGCAENALFPRERMNSKPRERVNSRPKEGLGFRVSGLGCRVSGLGFMPSVRSCSCSCKSKKKLVSDDLGNTRCGLAVSAIIQGEAIAARRSCYSLPGQAVQPVVPKNKGACQIGSQSSPAVESQRDFSPSPLTNSFTLE